MNFVNQVLGWLSLIRTSKNPFKSSTYIALNVRYKGLGKLLLQFAIDEAEKSDLEHIIGFVAVTNKAAKVITAETGWVEIGNLPLLRKSSNNHPETILVRPV